MAVKHGEGDLTFDNIPKTCAAANRDRGAYIAQTSLQSLYHATAVRKRQRQAEPCSLLQLPTELLQIILEFVADGDYHSFSALISSCKTIYRVYRGRERALVPRIARNLGLWSDMAVALLSRIRACPGGKMIQKAVIGRIAKEERRFLPRERTSYCDSKEVLKTHAKVALISRKLRLMKGRVPSDWPFPGEPPFEICIASTYVTLIAQYERRSISDVLSRFRLSSLWVLCADNYLNELERRIIELRQIGVTMLEAILPHEAGRKIPLGKPSSCLRSDIADMPAERWKIVVGFVYGAFPRIYDTKRAPGIGLKSTTDVPTLKSLESIVRFMDLILEGDVFEQMRFLH